MKEEDRNKNQKSLKSEAEKRVRTGLFLSAFGENQKIQVSNEEINNELRKQMGMMPGQEKIIQDYYQKNPAALNTLRGSIYEEKIINEIKKKGKSNKKEISKAEAEKILKEENERQFKDQSKFSSIEDNPTLKEKKENKEIKQASKKNKTTQTKPKTLDKKKKTLKKVSKK